LLIQRDKNNLQIKTRIKEVKCKSYKVVDIVDDDQFKTGFSLTFNKKEFPWHRIKYKIWNSNDCFQMYSSYIKDEDDFIEHVLSIGEIQKLYLKFSNSPLGKEQNKLFLKEREFKEKECKS
jgi:hypothetical protein